MPPVFPNTALGLKVELLLGGTWTDVSAYVRGQTVSISGAGRADWTSSLQAAQLTLTLNNRDGRFTPKFASGAYYPNITRNTQIRASVSSQSVTGALPSLPLNANTGFESNVSNWTAESNATIARSTSQAHTGAASMSLHGDGTTANPQAEAEKDPVIPGVSYTATAWFFNTATWASGVLVQVNWYDAGNSFISSNNNSIGSLPANTWTQVSVTAAAPSNAAFGTITVRAQGTPAVGNIFFIDDATFTPLQSFRFWGEVAEWPPAWDVSGRNVYTTITANGPWRRYSQLQTPLGSAYRRYTVAQSKRSYWPMEDGTGSGQLVPYGSSAATANAVQSFTAGQAGLSLAANTDFRGSDGIPVLNAAKIVCTVPSGGTATNNETRFLLSVPANGDSASGSTNWNLCEVASAGTVAKFETYLNAAGTLLVQLRNSGGTVIASGTTTTNVKGQPYLASCELTPSGGNVAWAFRIIQPGAAGITESMTGTVSTASVGQVSTVTFNRANALMDTAVGHCSVTYASPASMVSAASALAGYSGEKAADRFTRICGELGITATVVGTAASSAAMGPQVDGTLAEVLQSIEDTDMGLLFESRTAFGLGYRCLNSMTDQTADAAFNYAGAPGIDPSLAPVYDDALTRNNVTITNWTGYSQQAIITTGPMSVSSPPNGIGNGYGYTRTVNAASDSQLPGIANWLINLGGCDEIRIPVITVKLARAAAASMFSAIPSLFIGDYLQVTNMPSGWWPSGTVKQLIWGYSEVIAPKQWDLSFNTVPESPYETGFSAGTVTSAQVPGSGEIVSTAPGAGGLAGLIANGLITPSMLNEGITVKTLGGTRTTISSSAPTGIDVGDLWINSSTGLISQWNGSSWAAIKFDGSATIQAASIITANIAASAITSSLIAAGTVVAGIVDATTVKAQEYDAFSTQGQFLAYDTSSPSSGHLINSIAGSSGTDTASNSYPKGMLTQQLALVSQGSAPPSFSGASQLYTSSSGRLRYLSSTGNDLVLDRCVLELTNYSMGTQTIPHILSGTLNYLAGEAQVGSEYELEIDGTYTTPSGTSATFAFDFFVDGAAFSAASSITVGTNINQTGLTYAFTLRFRATVEATGAGGTCTIACDGDLTRKDVNVGNTANQFATLNDVNVNCAFDTTANHSLAVYCNWSSTTGTGHSAITYRTRKTRRN